MLADTRILSRHRSLAVLGEVDDVIFHDQSTAQLHRVRKGDIDQQLLRAIAFEGRWVIFDLRSVQRSLGPEIASSPTRDVRGTVLYTLRAHFACAATFIAKAVGNATESWRMPENAAGTTTSTPWVYEFGEISSLGPTQVESVRRFVRSVGAQA